MQCPNPTCRQTIPEKSKFCLSCGTRFNLQVALESSPPVVEVREEISPEDRARKASKGNYSEWKAVCPNKQCRAEYNGNSCNCLACYSQLKIHFDYDGSSEEAFTSPVTVKLCLFCEHCGADPEAFGCRKCGAIMQGRSFQARIVIGKKYWKKFKRYGYFAFMGMSFVGLLLQGGNNTNKTALGGCLIGTAVGMLVFFWIADYFVFDRIREYLWVRGGESIPGYYLLPGEPTSTA